MFLFFRSSRKVEQWRFVCRWKGRTLFWEEWGSEDLMRFDDSGNHERKQLLFFVRYVIVLGML